MNPRQEDVEALARAIDRVVFTDTRTQSSGSDTPGEMVGLVSYLNDSFPAMALSRSRRDRLERRIARGLGLPRANVVAGRSRLDRGLASLDSRWATVVGGTALVLLGMVGFAVWRQRGGVKPAAALR